MSSADKQYHPLTTAIVRGLNDKLYDKRKNAALEVERLIKSLAAAGDFTSIRKVLTCLQENFAYSGNANSRKGGLIGLAAIAIALGQTDSIAQFLPELVPPVLGCFTDTDNRVRYYACEAMYNISKVARLQILIFFNRIFVGLFKLASDSDPSVKNGAELLDRLIKDIVNEDSTALDLATFVPLLQERIYTEEPHSRQFLVSWMTVLEAMPRLNIKVYLPTLLEGLFRMLGDTNLEIRRMCEGVLGEFLRDVKEPTDTDFQAMVRIVLKFCISEDPLTKLMAISWLHNFACIAKEQMLPYMPEVLGAVLPALSYSVDGKLRELAAASNDNLMDLISATDAATLTLEDSDAAPSTPTATTSTANGASPTAGTASAQNSPNATNDSGAIAVSNAIVSADMQAADATDRFNIASLIVILTLMLLHDSVATRLGALRWFHLLQSKLPMIVFGYVDEFVPALLKVLSDPSEKVVGFDLKVLAALSSCESPDDESGKEVAEAFFKRIMMDVLDLFSTDRELFEQRGSFIIRSLATDVGASRIYQELAGILLQEDDVKFASLMVQMLNMILLTSPELFDLRQQLKKMETEESRSFFCTLFKSWCHSPMSTYALCLLAQQYEHACQLLLKFSDLPMTVSILVEVDKLIQLLESPVFTFLRLQLLEPQRHAYLIKALYGLLMLLPQSAAFSTLKNRLDCIPTIVNSLQLLADEEQARHQGQRALMLKRDVQSGIDFDDLLRHFDDVQALRAQSQSTAGPTPASPLRLQQPAQKP